jgi:hypothetical protein
MKGYQIDSVLYVFPQTADTIPFVDSDVTIIYVQQEDLAAWKTKNSDNADMIFPYNYNVMTVQPKAWSGHTNDDIYVPVTPGLEWSASTATAQIGETNTFPTLTNPHSVTVAYSSSDSEKATINASTGEITLVAEGDTTISAAFAGDDTYEAQTVTYTLTVQAAAPEYATLTCAADYSELLADIPASVVQNDYTHIFPQSGVTLYEAYEASAKDENDNDVTCYVSGDNDVVINPGTATSVTMTLTAINPNE